MNKSRIKKLEDLSEKTASSSTGLPVVWRPESDKVAIQESSFILDRLNSLGREIVRSPYVFGAILVELTDREIIDRIEGRLLYLVGVKKPISGIAELKFTKS